MTNVTRSQFNRTLKNGVDLDSEKLKTGLEGTSVSVDDLKELDANSDGKLAGAELNSAFKLVDDFDRNGSARSFKDAGEAGQVYAALKAGKVPGPYFGESIKKAALDRVTSDGPGYAYDSAPTSPYKNLSGNKTPGVTRPSWLKNNNKCNQFVGDALTQAGLKMPTFKMTDGTEHYVNAERLPKYSNHFDRITDPKDIKPGDVFVVDYPASGESTAHTEVVTSYDPATGKLMSAGAHSDGAYEKDQSWILNGAKLNEAGGYWEQGSNKVYILRPKMLSGQSAVPIRG